MSIAELTAEMPTQDGNEERPLAGEAFALLLELDPEVIAKEISAHGIRLEFDDPLEGVANVSRVLDVLGGRHLNEVTVEMTTSSALFRGRGTKDPATSAY